MSKKTKRVALALTATLLAPAAIGVIAESASAAPNAQLVASTLKTVRYTRKQVNVRYCPGTDCGIMRSLPKGKRVVVDDTEYGWSDELWNFVPWSHLTSGGWVRSDLLRR